MGKYFGTDGFRGEANVQLTAEKAFKVGRFLGWYYGLQHSDRRAKIVIGKDTRRSSYMLESALTAGLTSSGADALLLHVTTTPSVSYAVRTEGFDCGVMISASHNPFYDNGIKIMRANGQKIEAEIEEKIEAYIDGEMEELPYATKDGIGSVIDFQAGRNRYIGYLLSIPTRSFQGKRIGLDCANGSSSSIAKSVFEALGAKVMVINNSPDGTNINRSCGSTHMESLQNYVLDNQLDAGFAYDGDADRCLAIDEKGHLVDGDRIMFICGKHMMETGMLKDNTVVTTIMSNLGLYKSLEAAGMKSEQTDVGDKYVAENMMEHDYSLGGEQSGHVIFSKYATTGDGILTSLMLMQAVVDKKTTLATLAEEMEQYPQLLKNIRVHDKVKAMENAAVLKAADEVTEELGDDGRILLRASGTEPKVRVMVEAKTNELCEKYVNKVVQVIYSEGLAE